MLDKVTGRFPKVDTSDGTGGGTFSFAGGSKALNWLTAGGAIASSIIGGTSGRRMSEGIFGAGVAMKAQQAGMMASNISPMAAAGLGAAAMVGGDLMISGGSMAQHVGGGAMAGAAIGTMIMPGIGTAIGAVAGAMTGLVRDLFFTGVGYSPQQYDKWVQEEIAKRRYTAPDTISREMAMGGGMGSEIGWGFGNVARPYTINLNISALDSRSILDRAGDIADALTQAIHGSHPVALAIRTATL